MLGGSGTDPNGDPLTYVWDLDGDGIFGETGADAELGDEVGGSPTFNAILDGPDSPTVALRVSDGLRDADSSVTVSVNNVDPTVAAGSDQVIDEGETFSGAGSFTDPGAGTWTATVESPPSNEAGATPRARSR